MRPPVARKGMRRTEGGNKVTIVVSLEVNVNGNEFFLCFSLS